MATRRRQQRVTPLRRGEVSGTPEQWQRVADALNAALGATGERPTEVAARAPGRRPSLRTLHELLACEREVYRAEILRATSRLFWPDSPGVLEAVLRGEPAPRVSATSREPPAPSWAQALAEEMRAVREESRLIVASLGRLADALERGRR